METHIIPVGFDYDRLIAPLVRDRHAVERVVLLEGSVGSAENVAYSQRLTARLRSDFETLLGAETQRITLEDVYDHDAAFSTAFTLISEELERSPADVWVNISSMPRPVSFAFATAAHSIMVEAAADRDRIHVYYTAPDRYLETELAEQLQRVTDRLTAVADDQESEAVAAEARRIIDAFDAGGRPSARSCSATHTSWSYRSLRSARSNRSRSWCCSSSVRSGRPHRSPSSPSDWLQSSVSPTPMRSARRCCTPLTGSGPMGRGTSTRRQRATPTAPVCRRSGSCGCSHTRAELARWVMMTRNASTVARRVMLTAPAAATCKTVVPYAGAASASGNAV